MLEEPSRSRDMRIDSGPVERCHVLRVPRAQVRVWVLGEQRLQAGYVALLRQ